MPDKRRVALNSNDVLFKQIRDLNFVSAPYYLSLTAKEVEINYKEYKGGKKDISDIKGTSFLFLFLFLLIFLFYFIFYLHFYFYFY